MLLWAWVAAPLWAQAQTFRVTSDKAAYAYGETLHFTAILKNTRPDTVAFTFGNSGGFFTNGQLYFDGRALPINAAGPTVPQTIRLPPGHRLEWGFRLAPITANLPRHDGAHVLRAHLRVGFDRAIHELIDSAVVTAPTFRGGSLQVGFRTADSTGVAEERNRLGARVSSHYQSSWGSTFQTWRLEVVLLDTVLIRLKRDPRFTDVQEYAYASPASERIVGAEAAPRVAQGALSRPWPHPFTASTSLRFVPGQSGPLRAEVFDLLGRHVSLLYGGVVREGAPQIIHVDGAQLPAGAYVVLVTMPGERFTRHLLRR